MYALKGDYGKLWVIIKKIYKFKYVFLQVPKLASAAEYFFKLGVEGKRFRPTVILTLLK